MIQADKLGHYHELFSDTDKAEAFDQLAQLFYAGNFGKMSKADVETLMFSIYLERILEKCAEDMRAYNDFKLSKELGITQSKVSSLKVKKQLQYPHNFDWKALFASVSKNVRYDGGKLKLHIPDINLYYEIKNAVEESGGYIDVTLTPKLLQISPEYFLDLLVAVSPEQERDKLRRLLRDELRRHGNDAEYFEEQPFGKKLKKVSCDAFIAVLEGVISSAITAQPIVALATNACNAIKAAYSLAAEKS